MNKHILKIGAKLASFMGIALSLAYSGAILADDYITIGDLSKNSQSLASGTIVIIVVVIIVAAIFLYGHGFQLLKRHVDVRMNGQTENLQKGLTVLVIASCLLASAFLMNSLGKNLFGTGQSMQNLQATQLCGFVGCTTN